MEQTEDNSVLLVICSLRFPLRYGLEIIQGLNVIVWGAFLTGIAEQQIVLRTPDLFIYL